MSTLPLALVGPLASYTISTHERIKHTALLPTKSAVCGLLGACLGRDYADDQRDLYALKVHLRADHVGQVFTDFQTVQGTRRADGTLNPDTFIKHRQYLTDSAYLAVIEGERTLLESLEAAIQHPHFLPYLGLRSCLPQRPLFIQGVSELPPAALMREIPSLHAAGGEMTAYFEDASGHLSLSDQPLGERRFTRRRVLVRRVGKEPDHAPDA